MFVCTECGYLFEESKHYIETHGFKYGSYEEWDGCPKCSGNYANAYRCNCCDEWIIDEYIKTENGDRYCNNCILHMELGEED